jgi:hypothetical protein
MGLLLTALHLARPHLLRRLVNGDTQIASFLPWLPADALDPDSGYQRLHRRVVIALIVGWTLVNFAVFVASYTDAGAYWLGG